MEYCWSNPSWKRIEVKSKQEDYQSKITRDMHNFYHGGGNRFNAYGGTTMEIANFTPRRHVGVESEHLECSKEKESELEKSERVKENERFIKKQESGKKEQREKDIVVLEKTVSFFASDTSLVDPDIVGLKLKCALIDVLHDKSKGKYVEQCDYVLPILGVFMRNINGLQVDANTVQAIKDWLISMVYQVLIGDSSRTLAPLLETKTNEAFEEGQASKFFIIYTISKDYSREKFGCKKKSKIVKFRTYRRC
ncbi:hypothetical protein M9H77_02501 [Catharanthus roseus]|uniref:Uncharacterized protein n=1 Tax=Catharanthus roseus TaxID=4058 RepID=A0ACC0C8K3_CATRO|nr:hypothetical protein M9H77_02501 [Catharanthus roseus]